MAKKAVEKVEEPAPEAEAAAPAPVRPKGKLEFFFCDPHSKKKDDGVRVVVHEHPIRPTKERWFDHIRQLAGILPSFHDQYGDVKIVLVSNYEINGEPRSDRAELTVAEGAAYDVPGMMYDFLIQPIVKAAKEPNQPFA